MLIKFFIKAVLYCQVLALLEKWPRLKVGRDTLSQITIRMEVSCVSLPGFSLTHLYLCSLPHFPSQIRTKFKIYLYFYSAKIKSKERSSYMWFLMHFAFRLQSPSSSKGALQHICFQLFLQREDKHVYEEGHFRMV